MRSPLLVTALLLAACGGPLVTSTQFRGTDGSPNWWGIQCKGNPTLCWREAGTVCPNGYAVIDKNEKPDNLRPDDCPPLDHEPRKFLPEAQQ